MNRHWITAATFLSISMTSAIAQAAEPLELRKVMQELGKNMQTITDGISREDWELVAATAPKIEEHPQPPFAEKARIISFMGSKMSDFKALDKKTHEAAHELLHAAHEKDGQKVIAAFQQVQTTCLNCHQTFRPQFVQHFYGTSTR